MQQSCLIKEYFLIYSKPFSLNAFNPMFVINWNHLKFLFLCFDSILHWLWFTNVNKCYTQTIYHLLRNKHGIIRFLSVSLSLSLSFARLLTFGCRSHFSLQARDNYWSDGEIALCSCQWHVYTEMKFAQGYNEEGPNDETREEWSER